MKSFVATDPSNHDGQTNTWLTPKWLVDSLGSFDLDPCAAPEPRPWATAKNMNSLPIDGLSLNWQGRVWLNPPYGKHVPIWLRRLALHGNGIALLFARTDAAWFQEGYVLADKVFLLKGRIRFCRPDGREETTAGTGSALFLFGSNNVEAVEMAQAEGTLKGLFI